MMWLAELRRPSLKCQRLGHKPRGEWRRGYVPGRGGWLGGVAVSVRQERDVCARCGVETFPWTPVEGQSRVLSGLTAPAAAWEQIERGGWWPEIGRLARPLFPAENNAQASERSDEDRSVHDEQDQGNALPVGRRER